MTLRVPPPGAKIFLCQMSGLRNKISNSKSIKYSVSTYLVTVIFLQGGIIACYAQPCVSYGGDVRLSVRHALTLCQNDAHYRITKFSHTDSLSGTRRVAALVVLITNPMTCRDAVCLFYNKSTTNRSDGVWPLRILVLGIISSSTNSKGFTSSESIKWEKGRKNQLFQLISRRISKMMQDRTIRSFDSCQNYWPWMTLNGRYALYCKKDAFSEPTTKIWMMIDQHYQRHKFRSITSGNIGYMRKFVGICRRGASNYGGVVNNSNFQRFRWLLLRKL